MIRNRIEYNGRGFLVWGYSAIFFSLLVYICLKLTSNELFYILYAGVPISANLITALLQKAKAKVKTETEILVDKIWTLFGTLAVLSCIGRYFYPFPLFAFISFLMGLETIITGIIVKHKTVSILGFIGILGMIPLVIITGYEQNLIVPIIFVFIAVIPAYIINLKNRKG